jgi:hypothetical protein
VPVGVRIAVQSLPAGAIVNCSGRVPVRGSDGGIFALHANDVGIVLCGRFEGDVQVLRVSINNSE